MIVWNHGDKPIFIVTEYKVWPNGGPARNKMQTCIAPGMGIDLEILGLKPEKPTERKGIRQQAVERLDAMSGRDEGGIVPPREPMSIDRSPPSWWHGYDQRNCEHK